MEKRDILETGDSDTDNDSDRYRNEPGSGELHVGSPRRCVKNKIRRGLRGLHGFIFKIYTRKSIIYLSFASGPPYAPAS